MINRDIEQEASIPTAARINLVSLAEMYRWWEDNGYRIKSMSQLISWSINLLRDTLRNNKQIPIQSMTLVDAKNYLNKVGVYQSSTRNRSTKKEAAAIRFEGMREEGLDPKTEDPTGFNVLHNKRSVEPSNVTPIKVRGSNGKNWIPLPDYPGYVYEEGNEEMKDALIKKLKDSGIKSQSELTEEDLDRMRNSINVIKDTDNK